MNYIIKFFYPCKYYMNFIFGILLIFIYAFLYFLNLKQSKSLIFNTYNGKVNGKVNDEVKNKYKENFKSDCWTFGDDYNSCYANSNCTVGFLPDGSTHCMEKFLKEDI